MTTKICNKCEEEKSIEEFYRNNRLKDGRLNTCKSCKQKYNREYYEKNREKEKERSRKYQEKNKERFKEEKRKYAQRYREENKDKVKERNRKYREENREEVRDRKRKYYEENKLRLDRKMRKRESNLQELSSALATKTCRWSEEEEQNLARLIKTHTIYQCAIELGRSYNSVRCRIQTLRKQGAQI